MMLIHLNQLILQFLVLIILAFGIRKLILIFQMICLLVLMVRNVFARGIGYMEMRGNKVMEMNFIVSPSLLLFKLDLLWQDLSILIC